MARKLPPLNALRAFDAAARLGSFSKAADEIFVTHGAVSRAVRKLEDDLGQPLFRRTTRSVTLTATGEAYAHEVRSILDRLSRATDRARAQGEAGALNVSTLDSFASMWLLPRLRRFRQSHPGIDVRLSTAWHLVDFVNDDIDIALRYGMGRYENLVADFLMDEDLFPVCSPELLKGPHPLVNPQDLQHHELIHDDFLIDWKMWLTAAGIEDVDATRGASYEASDLAIMAAIQGDGVALGRSKLVEDDIVAGRLVKPFDLSLSPSYAYYAVYPPGALETPRIRVFRDWIIAEARSASDHST
jgi:LysR family glycine cleavage system transcriptional activator